MNDLNTICVSHNYVVIIIYLVLAMLLRVPNVIVTILFIIYLLLLYPGSGRYIISRYSCVRAYVFRDQSFSITSQKQLYYYYKRRRTHTHAERYIISRRNSDTRRLGNIRPRYYTIFSTLVYTYNYYLTCSNRGRGMPPRTMLRCAFGILPYNV